MNFLSLLVIFMYSGTILSACNTIKKYDAIFNFGDSISDTGNFLRSGSIAFPVIGKLPYGMTFFQRPTGRCSEGRLVVDFVACGNYLKKSLFLVGEIGGNDYNYAFFSGGTIQQVEALVPIVVEAIMKAIIALIEQGAVELVVPGNFPIGCSAAYLTFFQIPNKTDYDSNGCLKAFNNFFEFHNGRLKCALEKLRRKYRNVKIIYADYYGATMQFVTSPLQYGFQKETVLKVCCGGGGPYNYNISESCGKSGSTVCEDPTSYANWDGIHLTEAAYRIIVMGLVFGPFTSPPLLTYPHPLKDAL